MSHVEVVRHVTAEQSKTVTVTCTNSAGTATDPTTLTAVVTPPDGSTAETYVYNTDDEWERTSAGVYTFTYTPDSGNPYVPWRIRFKSVTSGVNAVTDLELWVDP